MVEERKDAVARLLEYLRFRTISGEGPRGSYAQVTMASCLLFLVSTTSHVEWCANVLCAVVTSAQNGSVRTLTRVSAVP